jgi:TolB protein
MRRATIVWLLALLLAGCAPAEPPQAQPSAAPARGELRGEELAGRLLFVRAGVIWQWQGREARPLLGSGQAFQPAWSPDGQRIAYVIRANSSSDIGLADGGGAPLASLTANSSGQPPNSLARVYESMWAFYPAWSPDGTQIALAGQPGPPAGDPAAEYNLGLYTIPAAGGARTALYSDGQAQCGRSVYSPAGDALIFTRAAGGADGQQLYRLDLASGVAAPFPGAPKPSYDPARSADGRWLAFAASAGGRTDLFALPLAGGGAPLRLSESGSARAPAFSPDGRQLAFLAIAPGESGFDLWVADLSADQSGGLRAAPARRLTTHQALDADSGLSWAP